MKFISFFILLFAFTFNVFSQYDEQSNKYSDEPYTPRPSLGVFGAAGLNFHLADFQNLPNTPSCCPGFSTGTGLGYNFGLFYSFPIADNLDLNLRGIYYDFSADLTTVENENTTVSDINFNPVSGEFEHAILASISTFGLEPMLQFKLTDQLRISGGFRITYLISGEWEQYEEIISPSNGGFIDENGLISRRRNEYSGGMDQDGWNQLDLGLSFAASYDLPLNKDRTLFLVPEAKYTLGVLSYISDQTWIPSQFTGGVGIRYAPRELAPPPKLPPSTPPPPPIAPPPPPPAEPDLDATIAAVSVREDGTESSVTEFKVEEFFETKIHPLLNYVFFDHNSSQIPSRYTRMTETEKKAYSFKQFFSKTTMEVYYDVLNIVGKRMQVYPQAEIKLIGCNSNKDEEKGNIDLSRKRAEQVRDYLINEWNILPERIQIEARNLPPLPSNVNSPDGIEENRRVEIVSNMKYIFEPMMIRDTLRDAELPHLRFKPQINTPIGVQRWEIRTSQAGRPLKTFSGNGEIPKSLDWKLESEVEQRNVPNLNMPLEYKLVVIDNNSQIWESPTQKLPVRTIKLIDKIFEMADDKEIDRFSMIGFGYSSADLTDNNQVIADIAVLRLRDESEVDVIGHSDRLGNDDFNMRLSQRRAASTADYMNEELTKRPFIQKQIDKNNARGVGESKLLYNNDLPEGRFYSRTVRIKIETPIE